MVVIQPTGKPSAWDVTVPPTSANSHLVDTATADKAVGNKETKYRQLANSHIFVPVAIESAATWIHQAVELVLELGRRMTAVTEDTKGGGNLPVPAVVSGSTTGKCGLLPQHSGHCVNVAAVSVLLPTGRVLVGFTNNNNKIKKNSNNVTDSICFN